MTITEEGVLEVLIDAGAILHGHFQLTSGLHSDTYVQCARVLEDPALTTRLAEAMAALVADERIDVVAAPAVGGIIIGFAVAQALGVRFIFSERQNGEMVFRRGFSIEPGERVLVVEDVVTTGGSVAEVVALVQAAGGEVAAVTRSSTVAVRRRSVSGICLFFDWRWSLWSRPYAPSVPPGRLSIRPEAGGSASSHLASPQVRGNIKHAAVVSVSGRGTDDTLWGNRTGPQGGTMALPNLSEADRKKALEKAAQARQARAELRQKIKSGSMSFADVMAKSDDPIVGRMKVSTLLESLPGFGKAKAAKIMSELEISASRRVQGLGARQRELLMQRLG